MKAMLLAAGEGTRLRPLTHHQPKALLPIGGVPLLELTLSWLKSHGVSEVAINLHHLGEKVRDFLGDGSSCGVRVYYSVEETILGTAGGVKRVEPFFDDTFVVVYGDILTDFDIGAMSRFHESRRALATMALVRMAEPWDAGVVSVTPEGRVSSFVEKPPRGSALGNLTNGGVYVLEKAVLGYIPQGFSDFGHDIFPKLLRLGLPLWGYSLEEGAYHMDIGTPERYQRADGDVRQGKVKLPKAVGLN